MSIRPQFLRFLSVLALFSASGLLVRAHVTVDPTKAQTASVVTINFRVPSEGGRTTHSVELIVPEGIEVRSLIVPEGGSVALVRGTEGQPDRVVWTVSIPPSDFMRIALDAIAPATGRTVWRIRQSYSNGDTADWAPTTEFE